MRCELLLPTQEPLTSFQVITKQKKNTKKGSNTECHQGCEHYHNAHSYSTHTHKRIHSISNYQRGEKNFVVWRVLLVKTFVVTLLKISFSTFTPHQTQIRWMYVIAIIVRFRCCSWVLVLWQGNDIADMVKMVETIRPWNINMPLRSAISKKQKKCIAKVWISWSCANCNKSWCTYTDILTSRQSLYCNYICSIFAVLSNTFMFFVPFQNF